MLFKLPAAWLSGVRLSLINDSRCEVKVKFKWINQNPYRSMFWAVQGMAAELTTGMLVTKEIRERNVNISMLVTSNSSKFLKKATGRITFSCDQGFDVKKVFDELDKENSTSKILLFSKPL